MLFVIDFAKYRQHQYSLMTPIPDIGLANAGRAGDDAKWTLVIAHNTQVPPRQKNHAKATPTRVAVSLESRTRLSSNRVISYRPLNSLPMLAVKLKC